MLPQRLEGLTPPQVHALMGTDTDLRALRRRMYREGVIARPAKGVYAIKTPGAPHSSLGPAGAGGETTEDEVHFHECKMARTMLRRFCTGAAWNSYSHPGQYAQQPGATGVGDLGQ